MPENPAADLKAQDELSTDTELTEVVEVSPRKPALLDADALSGDSAHSVEAASPHSTERESVDNVAEGNTGNSIHPDAHPLSAKLSLLPRCWAIVAPHALLITGCAASLLMGVGMGTLAFRHAAVESSPSVSREADKASASSSVRLVATTNRRNEPIKPLLPIELEQAVVDLGRRLFHEPALSGNGRMSCVHCHNLTQAGTSHEALPRGFNGQKSKFNAPSVLNAALSFAYGWEGRFATLEDQLDAPITHPDKLGSSWERVLKFLDGDASYRAEFIETFAGGPTRESVAIALASYLRSLLTPNSQFDQWLAGDESALNSDEFGGYHLFKKYGCVNCHQSEGVGGSMFQPLGVAKNYFESPADPTGLGRFAITQRERDRHVFRVPALRNVAATAPYLHDGRAETLEAVVAIMLEFQCGEPVNSEDVRRLTAFLKTLSGDLPDALAKDTGS
ncbi:MAG: c-type cytochrome [Planctomycetales bacterium]|nr:c-type cytochrome [Planctomycetales bacterium]